MDESTPEIIIGRKPVIDALQNQMPVSSIWIDRSLRGNEEIRIRHLAREQAVPLKRVSREILNKKSRANHQGVIAYTSPIRFVAPEHIIDFIFGQGEMPFLLYLDRIQDVGNLGSIIRSAEVMGVHAILIPADKMAPVNDQVVKISAGAVFHLSLCRTTHVKQTFELLRNSGIRILASSLEGPKTITQTDLTGPVCLVVGSEDTGISTEIKEMADELFMIPQYGQTDSLNAAVATGMMLYEAQRQRQTVH